MRECAYVRVSTELLEQKSSYENQIAYYKDKGIVNIYSDKESATTINRRGFQEMLKHCGLDIQYIKTSSKDKIIAIPTDRPSKYKYIYCKSISRFSRDISSSIDIIRTLKTKGVYCIFEQENINTENNSDNLLMSIMLSIAQQESINTSERVKWGNQRTAKQGVFRGHNIIGYDYNKLDKSITINEQEAQIVKLIFSLRLEGKGSRVIANILNEKGYKTKQNKEFSANTVQNILQNKTYCGYSRRMTFINEGFGSMTKRVKRPKSEHILVRNLDIPIIISEQNFERVQNLIYQSKHQYKNIGKNTSKNPLVGKIICSKCGGNYVKVGNYYVCLNKHKKSKSYCNNSNILIEDLEKLIAHHTKIFRNKARVNLNVINITLDGCISVANSKRDNNTTELLEANTEAIRRHKQAINKLLDMMLDNNATSNDVIREKIDIINEQIAKIERDNEILKQGESYINDFINRCEKLRDKITTYINGLPRNVLEEHYVKDYLISIKVGDKLKVEDRTVKYTKEVLSLYDEIHKEGI